MGIQKQKDIFLQGEGNHWYDRARQQVDGANKCFAYQQILNFVPAFRDSTSILEIGCSSGNKLDFLAHGRPGQFYGIDPSAKAIEDGKNKFERLNLFVGTADNLPFEDAFFDLIIFGFCLYLCDREDLFKIAAETDRCLKKNGFLAIIDFFSCVPYSNTYKHADHVFSYKMNYANLFLWHPSYSLVSQIPFSHSSYSFNDKVDERVALQVLYKDSVENVIPCDIYCEKMSGRTGGYEK